MQESTGFDGGMGELGLNIEGLLRRSARQLIQQAIEGEVQVLLEEYAAVRMVDGRRAVVRNGYLPEREILTAVGPVPVQVPKVRDRSGSGVVFRSSLVPPYVRKSRTVAAALPWLYLHGVSSGRMHEALSVLLGEEAKGLSPAVLGRLKVEWAQEHAQWQRRSLQGKRYTYWWADGVYTQLRAEDDPRMCLLVIIGVTAEGKKEVVAVTDGLRESKASWLEILRDLRDRGLQEAPLLAIGDGAMGFWAALDEIYPQTRHQRCWVHKTANILNELPKRLQGKAKAALQAIWMADTREAAEKAWQAFVRDYQAKYPRAVAKLEKDRDVLLTFFDFPAEHWRHIRSSNAIESTFATVRQRSSRTKNCVSRATFLGLSYKLIQQAERHWRGIQHPERLRELFAGVTFVDGMPANETRLDPQQDAA
uniref:Mutator family transposase n=1 Tax=Acidithiobacillus caldus TaxID=33059 RepID=K9L951_9PROT|nr:transposase [Acidithiobacillus caldus]